VALTREMKSSLRRVGEVFRDFADERGWPPTDYALRGYLNLDWGRINVVLAAGAYNDRPTGTSYREVFEYLDRHLADDLSLRNAIELFLEGYTGPETDVSDLSGKGDLDVSDLMNLDRPDVESPAATRHG